MPTEELQPWERDLLAHAENAAMADDSMPCGESGCTCSCSADADGHACGCDCPRCWECLQKSEYCTC